MYRMMGNKITVHSPLHFILKFCFKEEQKKRLKEEPCVVKEGVFVAIVLIHLFYIENVSAMCQCE